MDFSTLDAATFWMLVGYIVIRDAVIPLLNKLVPAKMQQTAELEQRETAALEKISNAIVLTAERLQTIEQGQGEIIKVMQRQSEALAVVVDRVAVERKTTPRKK